MKFERDRRKKRWSATMSDPGAGTWGLTFDAKFWDREINVGDRKTLMVCAKEIEQGAKMPTGKLPVGHFSIMLGDGQGPIVHSDVLAIFPTSVEDRFQIEIKVTCIYDPTVPAVYEVPDGAES